MATGIRRLQKDFEEFKAQVVAGLYTQRQPLGPGAINKTLIKSRSIVSSMLDVDELSSVAANTGSLTVTGALAAGSGTSKMAYDPSNGLYLGADAFASAPFRVSPAGAMVGTNADITGAVTANTLTATQTGQLSSWSFDSSKLSNGNTGLGTSGAYRVWSGNLSSPSLADFSVDNGGNIKSAGGTIGGMSVSSSDMSIPGGGGIGSNGGYNLWSGSTTPGSAPFRVNTSGSLTANSGSFGGSLNGASGSFSGSVTTSSLDANGGTMGGLTVDGTLTIGLGGKIQWASSQSFIDQSTIRVAGDFPNGLQVYNSTGSIRGQISANGGATTFSYQTWGTGTGYVTLSSQQASLGIFSVIASVNVNYNAGTPYIQYQVGNNSHHLFSVGTSGYIQFNGLTKGGSTGTWSANAPAGASWVNINIDGTTYRIAIWANS